MVRQAGRKPDQPINQKTVREEEKKRRRKKSFRAESRRKSEGRINNFKPAVFPRYHSAADNNTMGLFVSISGFNDGAIKAASKQRTPMLLLDHSHIFNLILRGVVKLPEVVSRIKRHASQTGCAHLPASDF